MRRNLDEATCSDTVERARLCFTRGDWLTVAPTKRAELLQVWAKKIEDHSESLAQVLSYETNKPLAEAREVDLPSIVRAIRWAATRLLDLSPQRLPTRGVVRRPMGVVAVIAPWNYPLSAIGYNAAPALACGNSVVVKPSEKASSAITEVVKLAWSAGVPRDALSVAPGGPEVGEFLGRSSDVDCVTVTGSSLTGRAYLRYAAESNGKPVWTELGGKSVCIALDSSVLTERAIAVLAQGVTLNAGQICTGIGIILAQESIAAELNDRLTTALQSGPSRRLIDVAAAAEVQQAVAKYGGSFEINEEYVEAMVLPVSASALSTYEEIFGPVALLVTFGTIEELIHQVEVVKTGMAASIWGASNSEVERVAERLSVGTLWINCWEADDMTVPSGGIRGSGFGKTKGMRPFDRFTNEVTVWRARSDV